MSRVESLGDDVETVLDALDAVDAYDRVIEASDREEREVELLRRNRHALVEALQHAGERGYLNTLDRVTFRRHARIAGSDGVFPAGLLPESLPVFTDEGPGYPMALRKQAWQAWMNRFEAQAAERAAWCALHGVPDPVELYDGMLIPDEPFDGTDV